jgi:ribokinase
MPKVVVIGSANLDLTIKVDRLPEPGETVSGGDFYTSFGGKGANQAVAALRAGSEVRFFAKVGPDKNGEAIIQNLQDLGLDTQGILKDASLPSGVACIMVDGTGKNVIAVAPGSNRLLTVEDIHRAEPALSWADVLLIQLEIPQPAVSEAVHLGKSYDLVTILNPAPARLVPRECLSLVDILTPNETEAAFLSGISVADPDQAAGAAELLIDRGCSQVITTLGQQGCCWVNKDTVRVFPPFPVTGVDSTAAGDAFNGALACAVSEKRPMSEAIRFASAAGALTVTRKGAQDSLPTRDEITELLLQYPDLY